MLKLLVEHFEDSSKTLERRKHTAASLETHQYPLVVNGPNPYLS